MPQTSSTGSVTRTALHGVAELVLAGPQYRRSGTIRLRVTPDGIATVAEPALTLTPTELRHGAGREPVAGRGCRDLAAAAGIEVGAPDHLYHDGSGVDPDQVLAIDTGAAVHLIAMFQLADRALREFAPDQTPVLWPEHFDLGISVADVNYGVSAGDAYCDEPYAYVGPWRVPSGPFWNAPFGAARPMRTLPEQSAVVAFFAEGRAASAQPDRPA